MNQESLFDIQKAILYLTNNPDILNKLSQADLEIFAHALTLIKEQIMQQIILDVVISDPNLPEALKNAKEKLQTSYDTLTPNQESQNPVVPQSLPTHHNLDLESQKHILQSHLKMIPSLLESFNNPEEFIKTFLDERLHAVENSEEYKNLVKHCALYMVTSNAKPEKNFSGLTEQERTELGPHFINLYPDGITLHSYTLNPKSLSKFFERIGKPELITELDSYYKSTFDLRSQKSIFEDATSNIEEAKNKQNVIQDPTVSNTLESFLTSLYTELVNYTTTHEQLNNMKRPKMPNQSRNPFVRLYYRFFGKKKLEEAQAQITNFDTQKQALRAKLSQHLDNAKDLKAAHDKKLLETPEYALAYQTYLETVVQDPQSPNSPPISLLDTSSKFYILNFIPFDKKENKFLFALLLSQHNPETPNEQTIKSRTLTYLSQLISITQPTIDSLAGPVANNQHDLDIAYNNLSPEAQFLVDANIDVSELKSRYIDFETNPNDKHSPFAAALIVNALLKTRNIRSSKDAEELGLTFTQKDAEEMQQTITSSLTALQEHLKTLSNYGQVLEEHLYPEEH